MGYNINYADEFTAHLRSASSVIALAYGILDDAAVDEAIGDMTLGNDEPEAELAEDPGEPEHPVNATHTAFYELGGYLSMIPGVDYMPGRVTVAVLASVLKNRRVEELGRIRDALGRSAGTIAMAQVRRQPVDPRRALLVAKMVTGAECWANWQNEDPTGSFIETDQGLVPEPGTTIAFIVDCLNAAGCTYSNEEIRDAIPAMMAALGITTTVEEELA